MQIMDGSSNLKHDLTCITGEIANKYKEGAGNFINSLNDLTKGGGYGENWIILEDGV